MRELHWWGQGGASEVLTEHQPETPGNPGGHRRWQERPRAPPSASLPFPAGWAELGEGAGAGAEAGLALLPQQAQGRR